MSKLILLQTDHLYLKDNDSKSQKENSNLSWIQV